MYLRRHQYIFPQSIEHADALHAWLKDPSCNGGPLSMLPQTLGAFFAQTQTVSQSWLQLAMAVCMSAVQ